MIIDTHTHLYLPEFEDPCAAVQRALDAGVGHMVLPNVDHTTIAPMLELHRRYPEVTSIAMGLHPTEVDGNYRDALRHIDNETRKLAGATRLVAIGEIGMDLYWDKTYRLEQREAFALQCRKAVELDIPVIIHCREALDDTVEVIASLTECPRGVFHSFGGTTEEDVEKVRAAGDFYFGINGIVTFKNSRLRQLLPAIGIDRIVLETDSPYLAPVPYRGKRNESAYIVHTCGYVAAQLGLSPEETAEITTHNACRLFGLPMQ